MARFPTEEELRVWVENLDEDLKNYLPIIDEAWHREMVSCFQVAALRPDCQASACRAGAVVFHKIIKNHYRIDGNKRSAVICSYLIFVVNGLHLSTPPETLYGLAKHVAESKSEPERLIIEIDEKFLSACRKT